MPRAKPATLEKLLTEQAEALATVQRMKEMDSPMLRAELERLRILTIRSAEAIALEAWREQRNNRKA